MLITTSTNATTPGALPEGSFARATLAPGSNVVVVDVKAEGGYAGKLAIKVAYGGVDGELLAWPAEAVADASGVFGPGPSETGTWFASIPGPGYVYVVATALTSGQPDVTLRAGSGSQTAGIAGVTPCDLDSILLLGQSGTVNVSGGIWLKAGGRQTGVSFAPTTIPQGTGSVDGVSLATIYGSARPADAVGVRLAIDGDLWECRGAGDAVIEADFKAHPGRYLPVIALGPDMANKFGRVA